MVDGDIFTNHVSLIRQRFAKQNIPIEEMIDKKGLYLRISVIGNCNLTCEFCHNEGGPSKGRINETLLGETLQHGCELGFKRVQFTGGEPLLNKNILKYVLLAKRYYKFVGLTTNGILLDNKKIRSFSEAGISSIHISPQIEKLSQPDGMWAVPQWLKKIIYDAEKYRVKIRINLPVPVSMQVKASDFITELEAYECDIEVFTILPYGNQGREVESIEKIREMIRLKSQERSKCGKSGRISFRDYLTPSGVRCKTCDEINRCVDRAHALRLGVDSKFRPCLATRDWDVPVSRGGVKKLMEKATILALDY